MWIVRGHMGWTRAFHNTGWPHNSVLRSTYSGHVRSGSLREVGILNIITRANLSDNQLRSFRVAGIKF